VDFVNKKIKINKRPVDIILPPLINQVSKTLKAMKAKLRRGITKNRQRINETEKTNKEPNNIKSKI
jgi:hypothetical protein